MRYVDKRLSDWNFMTYIQCTAERSNLGHFIHFYYWKIMITFRRNFYCFLIHIIFKVLFKNCDITNLKIIHPITFRNCTKHPIKVLWNKITSCTCNLFIKRFTTLHLNIFVPNVFNKRNLPEIQGKNILCLPFNHAKESVSSKNVQLGF